MKFFVSVLILIFLSIDCTQSQVKVKMYDHRAEHDSKNLYGTGPWRYLSYGYGYEYQYHPNGRYQREKGYGFLKTFGRDFCKYNNHKLCRPSDPKFFHQVKNFNNGEPFWGQPSADVLRDHEKFNSPNKPPAFPKWLTSVTN